jgi:hypothetical protein
MFFSPEILVLGLNAWFVCLFLCVALLVSGCMAEEGKKMNEGGEVKVKQMEEGLVHEEKEMAGEKEKLAMNA